jgi:ribose 5-phosphate isomerase A
VDQASAELRWGKPISNFAQKAAVARRLTGMIEGARTISVGSGSTSFLTICEIADAPNAKAMRFITTSFEIEAVCLSFALECVGLNAGVADVAFDGADEIDPAGNLIKGRGGAFFMEKLALQNAARRIIVADPSKKVAVLGERMPLPIEVVPIAAHSVMAGLSRQHPGSRADIRMDKGSDSPTYTPRGNIIVDLRAARIDSESHAAIKALPGVLESGYFPFDAFEFLIGDEAE